MTPFCACGWCKKTGIGKTQFFGDSVARFLQLVQTFIDITNLGLIWIYFFSCKQFGVLGTLEVLAAALGCQCVLSDRKVNLAVYIDSKLVPNLRKKINERSEEGSDERGQWDEMLGMQLQLFSVWSNVSCCSIVIRTLIFRKLTTRAVRRTHSGMI